MTKIILTIIFFIFFHSAAISSTFFSTWEGFEIDKLASVWLIKRFISPDAKIVFYPKNQIITGGVQFDTPLSEIKRKFNQSSFDALLMHYHINDPKLSNMAKLVHDIEINVWENKIYKKTHEIEVFFMVLLTENQDNDSIIQRANEYFDGLYEKLPEKLKQNN